MQYCFCKTEEILAKFKADIAEASSSAAQAAECEATIREKGSDVTLDSDRRVGVTASYDTHWQMSMSGWSYNSSSGTGYMVGVFTALLIARKLYSKL
eukprot:13502385-Ditylum_brightwellii.AAC.1